MGRSGSGWLRPEKFNISGRRFSSVSLYKKTIINEIDNRKVEFYEIHRSLSSYLKFLVNNASAGKSFDNFKEFYNFLSTSLTLNEIEVYFAEVVGPIYLIEDPNERFVNSSIIEVPGASNQSGYDFKIDDALISAKTPRGEGNTLKPGDIISNSTFKKFIQSKGTVTQKKLYQLFKVLNENTALNGPMKCLYDDGREKSVLNEISKKKWGKLLPEYNQLSDQLKRATLEDNKSLITDWSKEQSVSTDLKHFLEEFLKSSGTSFFSLQIDRNTGSAIAKHKTEVKNAYIKGKGKSKPGEKLGIAFKF